jgi:hypothetical protein
MTGLDAFSSLSVLFDPDAKKIWDWPYVRGKIERIHERLEEISG